MTQRDRFAFCFGPMLPRLAVLFVAMAVLLVAPTLYTQTVESKPTGGTVDDQIMYGERNPGDLTKPDCIEIAPMVTEGQPQAGTWTGVSDTIWSAILARTGIIPGQTDPDTLVPRPGISNGATGYLGSITDSAVLNPSTEGSTSKRMTFGYFVRMRQNVGGKTIIREVFMLMSYDFIDKGLPEGNPAAFEVFIFGPLPTPGMYGGGEPTELLPLQDGLAVQGDGQTLTSVPLNIAMVNNYKSKGTAPNTSVTPGVEDSGQGCMQCHESRKDDYPNSTGPFPWRATFGDFTSNLTTHMASGSINCPPPSNSVLQNNVLGDIGVEVPKLAQPNRHAGDDTGGEGQSQGQPQAPPKEP